MVHNLRHGVTPVGLRLVCPRSERRFNMFFSFPFGLFLCVVTALRDMVTIWVRCWSVPTSARPTVVVVLSFWMGFDHLSEALLSALSLLEVVLAEDESLLVVLSSLQCSSLSHVMVTCPLP